MKRHCPTCRCAEAAAENGHAGDAPWQPYSITSTGWRACVGCQAETVMPGRQRWVWRNVGTSGRRRQSESLCPRCQVSFANRGALRE